MTTRGTILRWFADRGFGFATAAGQRSTVFLHVQDASAWCAPEVGDAVEIGDVFASDKGLRGRDWRLVDSDGTEGGDDGSV